MRKLAFFLLFALVTASGMQVRADDRHPRDRARSGEIQPLDQILPQLRGSYPGTFYDADGPFPDGRGGYRYRIKWLTPDGRVIWLDTDARTGRVMGTDRSERERGNNDDSTSRRDRFDGDRQRDDRSTSDPWNRDNGRRNDDNNSRSDRGNRDNVPRNNDRSDDSRRHDLGG
ncbi:MAG: hypothetical protein HY243_10945 [Proteobacteria bacterium]|nr:hypothetical protein [Pseudomonadota bacterium]